MTKFDIVSDDTRALMVVNGEVRMTLDGEQAFGEWWMKDGRCGEYEADAENEVITLTDYDGNELAVLRGDADWEQWLGC
jgi:hypothetical protein